MRVGSNSSKMVECGSVMQICGYSVIHYICQIILDDIIKVIPGVETPTILNLKGRNDLVAVHAVCKEGIFWQTMEDLKDRGASSILVLPIEKILK